MSSKFVLVLLLFVALVFSSYKIVAHKLSCADGLDVVQIQSITSLSDSRWLRRVGNATELIKRIGSDSYFGFATFGDKNIAGTDPETNEINVLGTKSDYCLKVDLPLGPPNPWNLVAPFQGFHKKAAIARGGDWANNVFGGVYRALLAPELKWRPNVWEGKKLKRLVVVVVDAAPHLPGDVYNKTGRTVRTFDITEASMKEKSDENYDCDLVDYPSVTQLRDLLDQLKVGLVMLVPPGGNYDSESATYQHSNGLKAWYFHQLRKVELENCIVLPLDFKDDDYQSFYEWLLSTKNYNQFLCD